MINTTIKQLEHLYPHIHLSTVQLPENHSLNDMWLNYGRDGITKLLTSIESKTEKAAIPVLRQLSLDKLSFEASIGTFYVLGQLSTDLATLRAAIHFEEIESKRKCRRTIDLYDRTQMVHFAKEITEKENIDQSEVESELLQLTDLLEAHRETELDKQRPTKNKKIALLPEQERTAQEFLKQSDLLDHIDRLIEKSGIVGEANNRKVAFIIASTYKMPNPLHVLIQGTSGSGKTHLINSIAALMPTEDILNMTRVTSKSFYHYGADDLIGKLILIQDMDGLDDDAKFAFREMQSEGYISSSTIVKDKYGNLGAAVKTVNASFASLSATTHAEIYYDNMSRSIVLGIDESIEQTKLIIDQQNKQRAGLVDQLSILKAKELLQDCIRTLKPYEVVNIYADKIKLPVEAKMLRRLNDHYQSFVTQITILHQYQRQKDDQNRLIATVDDLKIACEILFDAIMWKIDELDSSLRQFFERLKAYINNQSTGKPYRFTMREIRQQFNLSKSQAARYMDELHKLEYIQIGEGSANKGFKYEIVYWDDMVKTREKVKTNLMEQIRELK
jgi:energy-coupling factor transporter ATP-binding protein EcfA2